MTVAISPYPSPDEEIIIRAVEKRMEEAMAPYDPSHDAYHVRRVRRTALQLARTISPTFPKAPDLLVVEIAALLHDVLDKKYAPPAALVDPYNTYFAPFFQSLTEQVPSIDLVKDGRAKEIAMIVENVSWTTEKKLRSEGKWGSWHEQCVELHCVQDADRLDAIGAFGLSSSVDYQAFTDLLMFNFCRYNACLRLQRCHQPVCRFLSLLI